MKNYKYIMNFIGACGLWKRLLPAYSRRMLMQQRVLRLTTRRRLLIIVCILQLLHVQSFVCTIGTICHVKAYCNMWCLARVRVYLVVECNPCIATSEKTELWNRRSSSYQSLACTEEGENDALQNNEAQKCWFSYLWCILQPEARTTTNYETESCCNRAQGPSNN